MCVLCCVVRWFGQLFLLAVLHRLGWREGPVTSPISGCGHLWTCEAMATITDVKDAIVVVIILINSEVRVL